MSNQAGLGNPEVGRTHRSTASTPARSSTGPMAIGLAVVGLLGVVIGGVYLALQRVPVAPPRTQQIGSVRVTFGTEPRLPWAGPAAATISIADAAGAPVDDAEVALTYDMQTDSIGRRITRADEPGRATARMNSPGLYRAPVTFTRAGQWMVRVVIARAGRQEGQGRFLVTVR